MVRSTSASEIYGLTRSYFTEEEEEESEEEEEDEEEEAAETQTDGLQTPSGLETPSGMASVVSTVAGGLETPDFLELRKNTSRVSDVGDSSSRSLYQVVPERQTAVRGLMGSDRAYDISGVSETAQNLPVLGEERGTKVSVPDKREFVMELIRYAPS
jgi:splicing factor 3B subunit 2